MIEQRYGGWSLRVFRMNVGDKYPKPYCVVAKRKVGPGKLEVFNVEGTTAEEAGRLAKIQIDEGMECVAII